MWGRKMRRAWWKFCDIIIIMNFIIMKSKTNKKTIAAINDERDREKNSGKCTIKNKLVESVNGRWRRN